MSVHINPGVTGAKRQSFTHVNPRDLLLQTMGENPKAGEKVIARKTFAAMMESVDREEYVEALFEYWFSNNHRSAVQAADVDTPKHKEATAKARTEAKEKKETLVRIGKRFLMDKVILLDYLMPNGKRLRNSTFLECLVAGGWLSTIGAKGELTAIVGKVLDEAAVHAIWKEEVRAQV